MSIVHTVQCKPPAGQMTRPQTHTPSQRILCYYHRRFGKAVQHCTQPCTWLAKQAGRPPIVPRMASRNSGLLFLCDTITKQQFVVDTGADVSVLPTTKLDRNTRQTGLQLLATNGSFIGSYGTHTLSLHFVSNMYQWNFIIADDGAPPEYYKFELIK